MRGIKASAYERNIDWVASCTCLSWRLAGNPSMCPNQDSNQRPAALQEDTQPAEPHGSRKEMSFRKI